MAKEVYMLTRALSPPRWRLTPIVLLSILMLFELVFASGAFAAAGTADPTPPSQLWLPTDQLWAWVAAALVTLPTYLFNHYAPYTSETAKGLVIMLTTGIAAGVTQAVTSGGVGFNQTTLQFVVTSVVAAFLAHKFVWQTTDISTSFKAGTNKQDS